LCGELGRTLGGNLRKASTFNVQGIANIIWATAALKEEAHILQDALPALVKQIDEMGGSTFNAQGMGSPGFLVGMAATRPRRPDLVPTAHSEPNCVTLSA